MEVLEGLYKRLKITPVSHNRWELLESFKYYRGHKGSRRTITVPKSFIFDGASIPRIFYIWGTPMATDTLIAALLHDYAYRIQRLTREEADEIFNEVMVITNVFWIKRVLYYLGVRAGGWIAWKNNKKALKNKK